MDEQFHIEPESTEEICTGLQCDWFYNKQVIAYRLTLASQKIIETWSAHIITLLEGWEKQRPYLALHDFSQPGVSLQFAMLVDFDTVNIGITPTGRRKVEELMDLNPEFFAFVAVNFNLSVSGQVNKVLANQRSQHPFIKHRTFYNRMNALAWLSEQRTLDDKTSQASTQ
jgi:hypothetical protein